MESVTSLSDHNIIYLTRKIRKPVYKCHNSVRLRNLKSCSKDVIVESLKNTNLSQVLKCQDVDKAFSLFKTMFLDISNRMTPVITVRIKQRSESWTNDCILKVIRSCNAGCVLFKQSKNQFSKVQEFETEW